MAWDHFCADQGVAETLLVVDVVDPHALWFRKTRAVAVDQTKRRPFQDVNK